MTEVSIEASTLTFVQITSSINFLPSHFAIAKKYLFFCLSEILAKAEWLTVDPYMRLRSVPGNPMPGGQVARLAK